MRRKLERNPVGWLQQRTWSGRLVSWSWLAILVGVYAFAITDAHFHLRQFERVQNLLSVGLLLSIGCAAAGSFRRERENGVLQLLLVSPLSASAVIAGRVKGLWSQFLPAGLMLMGIWVFIETQFARWDWSQPHSEVPWASFVFWILSYVTLPVVGLYFSLRQKAFLTAAVLTLGVGLCIPVLLEAVAEEFFPVEVEAFYVSFWIPLILQLPLAAFCAMLLRYKLERRKFAFVV